MPDQQKDVKNRKASVQDVRTEQLLKEYEQEIEKMKEQKREEPEPSSVRRELPKAEDYNFNVETAEDWGKYTDEEKKEALKGDMKNGWIRFGNWIMVAVLIGVIFLFKFIFQK